MPRRTLQRFLPQPHFVREHKSLRLLALVLHDPNLFHLNRRSVSLAAFVSVFVGLQPVPMHMLTMPYFFCVRFKPCTMVAVRIAPVAPSG